MDNRIQGERLVARIIAVALLLLGIGSTVWVVIIFGSGPPLGLSILAISICYFFAGWSFSIYLSPSRAQATEKTLGRGRIDKEDKWRH